MTGLLGTRWDVMQAPIGGAAGVDLMVAVARAGALPTIPATWLAPAELRTEIARFRASVDAPLAVNLVLSFDVAEHVEVLVAERPAIVTLSWGADAGYVRRLQAAGCRVFVQVGTVEAGHEAAATGADALIAQGGEAGGHVQSEIGLAVLVRGLVRSVGLPVVAAGGIADAGTAAAARAAGAAAVVAGTRFVASHEAAAADQWKRALVDAGALDTVLTGVFDIGWPDAPHRVLRNSTYRAWEAAGAPPAGERPGEGDVIARAGGADVVRYSDVPPSLGVTGDLEALCLYAGQGVELIDEVLPAAAIVELLRR